jgi:outer membrane protein OmpA-like peptidoglycan-associated protein
MAMTRIFLFFVLMTSCAVATTAQDIIVMKNGNEIRATILQAGKSEIKYKRFNTSAPVYTVKRSEVADIRSANDNRSVQPPVIQQQPQSQAMDGNKEHYSIGTLLEFVIEETASPSVQKFYKDYGCTPDDGVVVFYTAIPDLEFSIPDAKSKLKQVSSYDIVNKCYVLCVKPTDNSIGGINQYVIKVNGNKYIPQLCTVKSVKATEAQYFKINPKQPTIVSNTVQKKVLEKINIAEAKPVNAGEAIRVVFDSGILFSANSSTLSITSQNALSQFATSLRLNPDTDVQIYGHTDDSESDILSKKRAQSVYDFLESKGVSGSRMITDGLGSSQPVADNNTTAGKAANRRVEIYILPNARK